MISRQLCIADVVPRCRKEDINLVITAASAADDHWKSSTNKTRGLSSRAMQEKKLLISRSVRSSASEGEISIVRAENSSFGKSFSSKGTRSTRTGSSAPTAEEIVSLK